MSWLSRGAQEALDVTLETIIGLRGFSGRNSTPSIEFPSTNAGDELVAKLELFPFDISFRLSVFNPALNLSQVSTATYPNDFVS